MRLPLHINLADRMKTIIDPWKPIEIVRFNDQVVRMAKFEGEYHWHKHENEDEMFMVAKGQITIRIRGRKDIILREGEVAVVPKGVEHCPRSDQPSYVLMVEPADLQSTGS